MKQLLLLLILFLFATESGLAQQPASISVIDFVKITNGRSAEAMFFYENNWKAYRDRALKEGFIRSYRLLRTQAEGSSDFDLMLVTEYADDAQLKLSEERFNAIIKETNPSGLKLLNDVLPKDFRQAVFTKTVKTVFSASAK